MSLGIARSNCVARPIERMIGIGRESVEPNVAAIAAELDLSLRRLMARLPQALQLAGHEGIHLILPVGYPVVGWHFGVRLMNA